MPITDPSKLTQSNFNTPLFVADALTHLEDALRTSGYVNRQLEVSRNEWKRGNTINLKKPATVTVARDAYANMAAIPAMEPDSDQMVIDQYATAALRMNDLEEAIVGQNAWDMHARRIGYAIAAEVEREVNKLFVKSPHVVTSPISTATSDILIDTNAAFQELGIPEDGAQLRRVAVDANVWKRFLKETNFVTQNGAGAAGVATQQTADLPEKFGLVPYQSNQLTIAAAPSNAPTGGLPGAAAPAGAAIVGTPAKNSRTVTLTYTGLAAPTVFSPGMVIQLATTADGLLAPTAGKAYRQQLYCIESSGAVSGGNITVTLTSGLRSASHTGSWRRIILATADAAHLTAGAYYRDAIALAMVALPGNRPGVNIYTAQNPNSGLSMRAREVYDGITMNAAVIFDAWFGVKALDVDKMVRIAVNLNA